MFEMKAQFFHSTSFNRSISNSPDYSYSSTLKVSTKKQQQNLNYFKKNVKRHQNQDQDTIMFFSISSSTFRSIVSPLNAPSILKKKARSAHCVPIVGSISKLLMSVLLVVICFSSVIVHPAYGAYFLDKSRRDSINKLRGSGNEIDFGDDEMPRLKDDYFNNDGSLKFPFQRRKRIDRDRSGERLPAPSRRPFSFYRSQSEDSISHEYTDDAPRKWYEDEDEDLEDQNGNSQENIQESLNSKQDDETYSSKETTDTKDNDPKGDVWQDYYTFPWEMLNPDDLTALGLREYAKNGKYFDIQSLGPSFYMTVPTDERGLFIPSNTSLLFLFNTSRATNSLKYHNYEKKVRKERSPSEILLNSNTNESDNYDWKLSPQLDENNIEVGIEKKTFEVEHENLETANIKLEDESKLSDPKAKREAAAFNIIQTSLPFGLPRYYYVINYSLLIPKSLFNAPHELISVMSGDRWVNKIGLRKIAIPLSKKMLQTNGPILAFVFRSGQKLEDFVEGDVADILAKEEKNLSIGLKSFLKDSFSANGGASSSSSSGGNNIDTNSPAYIKAKKRYTMAKNHITDALVSSSSDVAKAVLASSSKFFDNFAKRWATTIGFESLSHSTFCQVNCRFHEQSYCLKFEEEGGAIVSLLSLASDELNNERKNNEEEAAAKAQMDTTYTRKKGKRSNKIFKRAEVFETLQDLSEDSYGVVAENIHEFMEGVRAFASSATDKYYTLRCFLARKSGMLFSAF